jgi:hypothetical protein
MSVPIERLPVWQTVKEALLLPLRHWQFVGSLMVGPVVLMTVPIIAVLWVGAEATAAKLIPGLFVCVVVVVLIMLAISWHRFILLGDKSVSASQLWKWSIRETRFLLYSAAISIIYLLVIFIPFIIFADIAALFEHAAVMVQVVLLVAGSIAVLAAGGYICGRLLLILPATAIDRRPTRDWMD